MSTRQSIQFDADTYGSVPSHADCARQCQRCEACGCEVDLAETWDGDDVCRDCLAVEVYRVVYAERGSRVVRMCAGLSYALHVAESHEGYAECGSFKVADFRGVA